MADQENTENVTAEEAAAEPEVTAEAAEAVAEGAQAADEAQAEEAPAAPREPGPPPKPPRSPEERQAERDALRRVRAAQRRRRRRKEREAASATAGERTPPPVSERATGRPKVRLGRVVSDKADKTITVRIDMARRHRRYEKIVRSSSTLHAHDETNDANEGDLVRVVECRPLSRSKRWRLVEVLERAR